MGFPCGSARKESACSVGDLGSIPGLGRSPGEGKSYPLQYSGLENSMDCVVHGVAESQTRLSDLHFTSLHFHVHVHVAAVVNVCVGYIAPVASDSLRPHGLCSPWNSPGQNTRVGSLSLLQGIFPTQGSNPGLCIAGRFFTS